MNRILTLSLLVCLGQIAYTQSLNIEKLSNWNPLNPNENIITLYNDVWGYADASGEYAIIGSRDSIFFVNITDPENPVRVDAFADGGSLIWRDFKTYKHYAYAGTESNEGLGIFDLQYLPDSVIQVYDSENFFNTSHNIFIDTVTAKLYALGASKSGSSKNLIILDISDTLASNPELLFSGAVEGGYIHDAYVRNDTVYASHGSSTLAFNEYIIHDCTDPNDIKTIGSKFSYPQEGYNHSSWVSDDGSKMVFADESFNRSLKMTEITVDLAQNPDEIMQIEITDLFRSKLLEPINGDTASIAHNPFIKGDSVYVSYYHDGLSVFDISDVNDVKQVAYYDTHLENGSYSGSRGAWGCYPYLPSGNILVSDLSKGLFVLKLLPCGEENRWVGPPIGASWSEDDSYWSLGRIPTYCDNVLIEAGNTVSHIDGGIAEGRTLTVEDGALLILNLGSLLDIENMD